MRFDRGAPNLLGAATLGILLGSLLAANLGLVWGRTAPEVGQFPTKAAVLEAAEIDARVFLALVTGGEVPFRR